MKIDVDVSPGVGVDSPLAKSVCIEAVAKWMTDEALLVADYIVEIVVLIEVAPATGRNCTLIVTMGSGRSAHPSSRDFRRGETSAMQEFIISVLTERLRDVNETVTTKLPSTAA